MPDLAHPSREHAVASGSGEEWHERSKRKLCSEVFRRWCLRFPEKSGGRLPHRERCAVELNFLLKSRVGMPVRLGPFLTRFAGDSIEANAPGLARTALVWEARLRGRSLFRRGEGPCVEMFG